MKPSIPSSGTLPAYRQDQLLLKLKPDATEMLGHAIAAPLTFASTWRNLPGLGALQRLERSGHLKRATPLSRKVKLEPGATGPARALATLAATASSAAQPDANSRVSLVELQAGTDADALCRDLADDPTVEFATRVPLRYLCLRSKRRSAPAAAVAAPAAVPPPAGSMWNLNRIRWAAARSRAGFRDADEVRVAVLDTGIDPEHPDLAPTISGYTYDYPGITQPSSAKDYIGHGTHVSGTIAAAIGNNLGINGVCTCSLHAWKIFDDQPDYYEGYFYYFVNSAMYYRALADCVEQGVQVLNLSIGGRGEPVAHERQLFDALLASGTTVVAAMGNERQYGSPVSYPAAIPGVIAVGATDIMDRVAVFSSRGPHIAVSAPGVSIWSTLPTYPGQTGFAARREGNAWVTGTPDPRDTDYAAWDGTSMASPHVAGAAALLHAKHPGLSAAEATTKIKATADKLPGMGGQPEHPDYGAGRLNLQALLA